MYLPVIRLGQKQLCYVTHVIVEALQLYHVLLAAEPAVLRQSRWSRSGGTQLSVIFSAWRLCPVYFHSLGKIPIGRESHSLGLVENLKVWRRTDDKTLLVVQRFYHFD